LPVTTLERNRADSHRLLSLALAITAAFLIVEVTGGILTGSLALLADAGHMASDVGALALSLGALWLASRPPTAARTFGFHRAEVLAALANSIGLILIAAYVFWEAGGRFGDPPEVDSAPMLAVAVAGLFANLLSASILYRQRHAGLNVRAAFLHVFSDGIASVGVIIAGVIMLATGAFIVDPIISVVVGGLILVSASRITWDATQVLLQATPSDLDISEVQRTMLGVPGVLGIHDLHAWTVTSGFVSLSAHVETDRSRQQQQILVQIRTLLSQGFGIDHATIQLETAALHQELEACCGVDTEEIASKHATHHA
jgi:cobalt-zinc-cadmium efflux system protein